jgi:hypothetical protein
MREELAQQSEQMMAVFKQLANNRKQRRQIRDFDKLIHTFWEAGMRQRWSRDPSGRDIWVSRCNHAIFGAESPGSRYLKVMMEGEPGEFVIAPGEMGTREDILERRAYQEWKNQQRK